MKAEVRKIITDRLAAASRGPWYKSSVKRFLADARKLDAEVTRLEGVVEKLVDAGETAFAFIGAFSIHQKGLVSGIDVMDELAKAKLALATPAGGA